MTPRTHHRRNRQDAGLLAAVIALLAVFLAAGQIRAQTAPQKWSAVSNTAISITGDIEISADNLKMAGQSFPLSLDRTIGAQQLGQVGEIVNAAKPTGASLYRIEIPASTKLLHGNTLCGASDAHWLLTVLAPDPLAKNAQMLSLAVLSGSAEPQDYAAIGKTSRLCATFAYSH